MVQSIMIALKLIIFLIFKISDPAVVWQVISTGTNCFVIHWKENSFRKGLVYRGVYLMIVCPVLITKTAITVYEKHLMFPGSKEGIYLSKTIQTKHRWLNSRKWIQVLRQSIFRS